MDIHTTFEYLSDRGISDATTMLLLKPNWLSHSGEKKDHEVYSCHVSPDGARLATAAGDGHVRIWSTDAILNAADTSYSKHTKEHKLIFIQAMYSKPGEPYTL